MDQISSAKINLLLNDIPLAVAKLQTVWFEKLKAGGNSTFFNRYVRFDQWSRSFLKSIIDVRTTSRTFREVFRFSGDRPKG